jgi:hypothetical protein
LTGFLALSSWLAAHPLLQRMKRNGIRAAPSGFPLPGSGGESQDFLEAQNQSFLVPHAPYAKAENTNYRRREGLLPPAIQLSSQK